MKKTKVTTVGAKKRILVVGAAAVELVHGSCDVAPALLAAAYPDNETSSSTMMVPSGHIDSEILLSLGQVELMVLSTYLVEEEHASGPMKNFQKYWEFSVAFLFAC